MDQTSAHQAPVPLRWSFMLIALFLIVACVRPALPAHSAPTWVETTDAPQILGNRWRLQAMRHDQHLVSFEHLAPVFVSFDETHLAISPTHCNFVRAALMPTGLRTYHWRGEFSTAMECPVLQLNQHTALITAFATTTAYTVRQDMLILTGTAVQITLVIDNTPPTPLPTTTPTVVYPAP